ncbi:hypothetical protein SDC9_80394 [bioreactor metagenome]|uniref:Uncharacterized protein n=1 Tax=bioreactor metagenome TaxID=1076179 RepID=A0A644Z513_9ZZZZ
MLQQHAEEPLDRPEQCPVDHHRLLAGAVGSGGLEVEQARLEEVQLDGRHLPGAPDRVLGLDRDLRAVERGAARVVHQLQPGGMGDLGERTGRLLPGRVVADGLLRVTGRQLQVEVIEAIVLEQVQDEGEQAGQLVLHLLAGAVDVRVVLGEAAGPGEAVHDTGLLVAVHRAELEQPQRQLAVGAPA